MEQLPFEVTEQGDAVEKHIAISLEEMPKKKLLNGTQSKFLLIGIIDEGEDKDDEQLEDLFNDMLKSSLPMILIKREFERVGLDWTKSALIWLGMVSDRPGTAKLYAIHVIHQAMKMKIDKLDCNYISQIFPIGIFEENDLMKVWDKQKVEVLNDGGFRPDNLVDYPTAFSSLKIK